MGEGREGGNLCITLPLFSYILYACMMLACMHHIDVFANADIIQHAVSMELIGQATHAMYHADSMHIHGMF